MSETNYDSSADQRTANALQEVQKTPGSRGDAGAKSGASTAGSEGPSPEPLATTQRMPPLLSMESRSNSYISFASSSSTSSTTNVTTPAPARPEQHDITPRAKSAPAALALNSYIKWLSPLGRRCTLQSDTFASPASGHRGRPSRPVACKEPRNSPSGARMMGELPPTMLSLEGDREETTAHTPHPRKERAGSWRFRAASTSPRKYRGRRRSSPPPPDRKRSSSSGPPRHPERQLTLD